MQPLDKLKSNTFMPTHTRNISSASASSSSSKSSATSSLSPTSVARSFSLPLPVDNLVALIKIDDTRVSDSNNELTNDSNANTHAEMTNDTNGNDCVDSNQDKAGPILTIPNSNYHKHNRYDLK